MVVFLPLGVLLDRFGPRNVEAVLLLFAGLGAFIFARAEGVGGLMVGRAFIGFGVSSCLMAAFKAYTLWFPQEKWPVIYGFQMAAGGLGALAVLTKNELLSVILGGIFVVEAVSVILQVGYFRMTGRRIFLMAPIHHHFEKKGWPEPRVIVRFWISAIMLAVFSLATLKLR